MSTEAKVLRLACERVAAQLEKWAAQRTPPDKRALLIEAGLIRQDLAAVNKHS